MLFLLTDDTVYLERHFLVYKNYYGMCIFFRSLFIQMQFPRVKGHWSCFEFEIWSWIWIFTNQHKQMFGSYSIVVSGLNIFSRMTDCKGEGTSPVLQSRLYW